MPLTCLSAPVARDPINEDSVHSLLPDLEVIQAGRSEFRKSEDRSVKINASDITRLSRTFGEIDFINQIRRLSGVTSNGDYSAGLSIDGSDVSQAQYLIDGAPVIYPYRFGGIFSTFNTPFFSNMLFMRRSPTYLYPVLGPAFALTTATRFDPGAEGMVNVGMTASSLAVRGGIGRKFSLGIAGRISYVDQIYRPLLEGQRNYINFAFNDINAHAAWKINDSDCLMAGFFRSSDNVGYDDRHYALDTRIRWNNNLLNISYTHQGEYTVRGNIYGSLFSNILTLKMPQLRLKGPSSLKTGGLSGFVSRSVLRGIITEWSGGLRATFHKAVPQWAKLDMGDTSVDGGNDESKVSQTLLTTLISGKVAGWIVKDKLKYGLDSGFGFFRSVNHPRPGVEKDNSGANESSDSNIKGSRGSYSAFLFNPHINLTYCHSAGNLSLDIDHRAQPLHQVGFSELGLASNFWIGSCDAAHLQRAFSVSLHATRRLPWWGLSLEASVYWRRMINQVEYQGEVMEVIDTDYDALSHLILSDGYNYGASVTLSRMLGAVTGELSYSYGEGRRHGIGRGDTAGKSWRALNSEGHTLKANAVWHLRKHWELSASFRYSSGRPYTPVEALYAIGGNIAMEYGERNSARLPAYQRLDLGATYHFTTGTRNKLRHLVNLSLLNAYGHRNVEMQYFVLNAEAGSYSLKHLYSLFRFLPSLSYTIEFR